MADYTIQVDINGDASGVESASTKAKSALSSIGTLGVKALGTITKATAAVVAAAGTAAIAIGKQSLDAYADYEQLKDGMNLLFKDSSDTIMQYAQNAYQTAGVSANEYMNQATKLASSMIASCGDDTAKAAELVNMAITDMSDNANAFGQDLSLIQNAYTGFAKGEYKMLDNLSLGFAGTKEGMQSLLDKANEINARNGEITDYQIDSLADITEAIHVVQEEMRLTGTTVNEAQGTISGSFAAMQATWTNLLAGLGSGDQDIKTLLTNFSTYAMTYVNNVAKAVQNILTNLSTVFQNIQPLINEFITLLVGMAPQLIEAGITLVNSLLDGILASAGTMATGASEIINKLANGIATIAPKLLQVGIVLITTICDSLTNNEGNLGDTAGQLIATLVSTLANNAPRLIQSAFTLIMYLAQGILSNLPQIISSGISLIVNLIVGIAQCIPTLFSYAPTIVKSLVSGLISGAAQLVEAGHTLLTKLLDAILEKIGDIFPVAKSITDTLRKHLVDGNTEVCNACEDVYGDLCEGMKADTKSLEKNVSNGWDSIAAAESGYSEEASEAVSENFDAAADDAINALLGIQEQTTSTFETTASTVSAATGSMSADVETSYNSMNSSANSIQGIGSQTSSQLSQITSSYQQMASQVNSIVMNMMSNLRNAFSQGLSSLTTGSVQILNTLATNFDSTFSRIQSSVDEAVAKLRSAFNFTWKLPKLKLPHIKITGSWSLEDPVSVPSFSVDWYAKGGVFDAPTLFSSSSGLGGLGEQGAEAVVPLEENTEWLDRIAERLMAGSNRQIVLNVDGKTFAKSCISSINDLTRQTGNLDLILG